MSLSIAIHLLISFLLFTVAAQTADTPPTTTSANGNTYTFEFFTDLISTNKSIWSAGAPFPESIWNIDVSFVEKPVQITYSSMELVAGQPTEPVPAVVDIMYINRAQNTTFNGTNYAVPANLPAGPYFVRTNITYSAATGAVSDSVLSPAFDVGGNLTLAAEFTCRDLPPWNNVTSLFDPKYSSLYITVPTAGEVLDLVTTGPEAAYPEFDIEYSYRDAGSGKGANIENLVLEFVQETTPPTGYYRSAGGFQANPTVQSMNYPYSSDTLDSPGLWCSALITDIRANYTPTGGSNVTYLSQPFYISSPNRPNTTCTEVCFGIGPSAPCYNNAGSAFRTPLAASIVIACALTLRNMFVL
ncbi:hypothetical protein FRB96_005302 [Tulasnella sp. 330]|nr:hypothetical protein FRB96_005302 [Tulasnella sp. 330]KAG8869336.1 hypothetical protein FRB98_002630 [Tulasnella sp. 332]